MLAGTALLAKEWNLATPAALVVGAAFLGTALLVFWLVVGSLDRVLNLIPEQHAARHFIGQLLPYTMRPSLIMRAVGWSLLVQAGGSLVVALIARALGVALPLSVWFAVVPLVALTMVVPVSINGVGVREGGLAFLLKPVGVSTDAAVAIGLLWFLATIVTGLIGGLLFLLDRRPSAMPAAAMPPAQPA